MRQRCVQTFRLFFWLEHHIQHLQSDPPVFYAKTTQKVQGLLQAGKLFLMYCLFNVKKLNSGDIRFIETYHTMRE